MGQFYVEEVTEQGGEIPVDNFSWKHEDGFRVRLEQFSNKYSIVVQSPNREPREVFYGTEVDEAMTIMGKIIKKNLHRDVKPNTQCRDGIK